MVWRSRRTLPALTPPRRPKRQGPDAEQRPGDPRSGRACAAGATPTWARLHAPVRGRLCKTIRGWRRAAIRLGARRRSRRRDTQGSGATLTRRSTGPARAADVDGDPIRDRLGQLGAWLTEHAGHPQLGAAGNLEGSASGAARSRLETQGRRSTHLPDVRTLRVFRALVQHTPAAHHAEPAVRAVRRGHFLAARTAVIRDPHRAWRTLHRWGRHRVGRGGPGKPDDQER